MNNALKLNTTFARIEFWAGTTIFAFVMFFFIVDGFDSGNAPYKPGFEEAGISFEFYKNFFIPELIRNVILFITLLYLNFIVVPKLKNKQNLLLNFALFVFAFLILALVFGLTDYYLREFVYSNSNSNVLRIMFNQGGRFAFVVFGVFSIYTVIKYTSLYLLAISARLELKYPFIRPEAIVATFIWSVILLFLVRENAPGVGIAAWIIAVPSAILLYLGGFYTLIPSSLNKRYPFISYAFKNVVILFIILMAWGLILKLVVGGVLGGDKAPLAALWIFNSILQMFVTVPITWWLYKWHTKGNEQLSVLQKELGQSAANLDFLRSQINPHFLFNALNTLYGTAIQENADRTSEGIQKLGDMMRFMLQENMQEKISLTREIEYMNNYISLQRLRTASQPDIQIQTDIELALNSIQVAPMLFIPFVENAFKHGISFREPSYINITFKVKNETMIFDVHNSRHPAQANDPEAGKTGIGLTNVKQRLQLLYSGRHELKIQETPKNFSIHLTIQTI